MKQTIKSILAFAAVLLCGGAWAAAGDILVSWNGDLANDSSKTANNVAYTMSGRELDIVAGKTTFRNGDVILAQAQSDGQNRRGLMVDFPAYNDNSITVVVKYRGYVNPNGWNSLVTALFQNSSSAEQELMVVCPNNTAKIGVKYGVTTSGTSAESTLDHSVYANGYIVAAFDAAEKKIKVSIADANASFQDVAEFTNSTESYWPTTGIKGIKVGGSIVAANNTYRPDMTVLGVALLEGANIEAGKQAAISQLGQHVHFSLGFNGDCYSTSTIFPDLQASSVHVASILEEKGTTNAADFEAVREGTAKAVRIIDDSVRPSYKANDNTFSGAVKADASWSTMIVAKAFSRSNSNIALWGMGQTSYEGSGDRGVVLYVSAAGKPMFAKYGCRSMTTLCDGSSYATSLYDGKLHSYIVTCDKDVSADKYSLYVDGVLVAASEDAELVAIPSSSQFFEVGTVRGGADQLPSTARAFGTIIDEVVAWKGALSSTVAVAVAAKVPTYETAKTIVLNGNTVDFSGAEYLSDVTVTTAGTATLDLNGKTSGVKLSISGSGNLTIKNAQNLTFQSFTASGLSSLTCEFDCTRSSFVADDKWVNFIKSANTQCKFVFKGEGPNGGTVNLGFSCGKVNSHLQFIGGTHNFQAGQGSPETLFTDTGVLTNPTVYVKDGATLKFNFHDLYGWNGTRCDTTAVRVDSTSKLYIWNTASNSSMFMRGQIVLEPGSQTTFKATNSNGFCFYGNAPDASKTSNAQIYVPAPATGATAEQKVAVLSMERGSSYKIVIGRNNNGAGITVDGDAILKINSDISINGTGPLVKYGTGTLELNGSLSGNTEIQVKAGTVKTATTAKTFTVDQGATLTLVPTASQMKSGYEATSVTNNGTVEFVDIFGNVLASEGCVLTANPEMIDNPVAEFGGTYYADLQSAVTAALENGGVVTVVAASSISLTMSGANNVTIKKAQLLNFASASLTQTDYTGLLTFEFNAVAGIADNNNIRDFVRDNAVQAVFKGSGTNGISLLYGTTVASPISGMLVFDGGEHDMKFGRSTNSTTNKLGEGDTADAPTILVKEGTKLRFVGHDVTGWKGNVDNDGIIRVNAGGEFVAKDNAGNTFYYRQQFYLDPGSLLTIDMSRLDTNTARYTFRPAGGLSADAQQFYIPASSGKDPAVIQAAPNANDYNGILLPSNDSNGGFGIFVGDGSTLEVNAPVQSVDSSRHIGKYGVGLVMFNGDMSGFTGQVKIIAGLVGIADSCNFGGTFENANAYVKVDGAKIYGKFAAVKAYAVAHDLVVYINDINTDPSTTFTTDWSGTVAIAPRTTPGGIRLAQFGNSSSTIVLEGIDGTSSYLTAGSGDTVPAKLVISGDSTINNGGSGSTYTFEKVSGDHTFLLTSWSTCAKDGGIGLTYKITDLYKFTGTIAIENRSNDNNGGLAFILENITTDKALVAGMALAKITTNCAGTNKRLDFDLSSTTVNGSTADLIYENGTVYLAAAKVNGYKYLTVQAAIDAVTAASGSVSDIVLLNDASIPSGYACVTGDNNVKTLRASGSKLYWKEGNGWATGTVFYMSDAQGAKDTTKTTTWLSGDTVAFDADQTVYVNHSLPALRIAVEGTATVYFGHDGDNGATTYNIPDGSTIAITDGAHVDFGMWDGDYSSSADRNAQLATVTINGGSFGYAKCYSLKANDVCGTSVMKLKLGQRAIIGTKSETISIAVPDGCELNTDTESQAPKTVYSVSVGTEITATQLNQLPSTLSVGNITLTVDAEISAKTLNSIGGNVTVTLKPGAGDKYVPYSKIKNLTLGANVTLKYSWNASRVISMSFGSGEANAEMTGDTVDGTLGGNVKRSAWNNVSAASGTVAIPNGYQNGTTDYHVSGMSATITCRGNYRTNSAKNYPFMKGYLDDNNNNNTASTITLNGVPFKTYDLVIYCQSDGTSNSFSPVKIVQGETATTYHYASDGTVESTTDTAAWGGGDRDFSYEYNTIRITGLSGQAVTITSNKAANNRRSCFAAVQVVQTSTDEEDAELGTTVATVDETEYKTLGAAVEAAGAKITAGAKTATVTLVSDLVATAEVVPAGVSIEVGNYSLIGSLKLQSGALITENGNVKIDGIATSLDVTYGSGTIYECLKYSAFGGLSECNGNSPEYTTGADAIMLKKNPWLKNVEDFFTTTEQITFATAGIMPTANNTIFAHMGSKNTWGLFLATGTEVDQVIVGYNQGTTPNTITTINVPNARTHRHTYIITKDDDMVSNPTKTTFTIYLDGVKWKTFVRTPRFEITGGFQVGSTFEGIISNYSAVQGTEATAYVNFIRAYQRIISKDEIDAYTEAYPYDSPNGTYERTIDADGNWVASEAWTSGDTTVEKPSASGNVVLTATHADEAEASAKTITVNLTEAVKYEKLTLEGDPMTFSRESATTEPIKSVCTVIGTTVTLNEGAIDLTAGPTILVEGGKLVFDFSSLTEAVVAAHPIAQKVTGDIEEDENIDNPTLAKVVVLKPNDTHINVRLEYIDGCYWVKADGVGFKGTSVGDDNGVWDYSNTPIIWTGANADVKTSDTTYTRTIGSQGLKYTLGNGYASVKVSMMVDISALNDDSMLASTVYKKADGSTHNINLKYLSTGNIRFTWDESKTGSAGDEYAITTGKHLIDVVFSTTGASCAVDGVQVIDAPRLMFSDHQPTGDIRIGSWVVTPTNYCSAGLKLYSVTITCGAATPTEKPFELPAAFAGATDVETAKLAFEFLDGNGNVAIPGAYKVDGGAVITNPAEIRELASLIGGNDCSSAVNFAMPFVAPEQTDDGNTMKVAIDLSHNVTGNVTLCVGTSPDGANTVVDTKSNPQAGTQTFTLNSISTQMGEGKVLYFKVKATPAQ